MWVYIEVYVETCRAQGFPKTTGALEGGHKEIYIYICVYLYVYIYMYTYVCSIHICIYM